MFLAIKVNIYLFNLNQNRFVLLFDCLFFLAAALLGQEIFVTGGQAEKEVINVAEVYSPELNQWEHLVARMESPRVGLSLVSMGNIIYAIGMQTANKLWQFYIGSQLDALILFSMARVCKFYLPKFCWMSFNR